MKTTIKTGENTSPNVVIILDSGFSFEVVQKVRHLVAFWDLNSGLRLAPALQDGQNELSPEQVAQVRQASSDPLNHGSAVLDCLLAAEPQLPVILIRCFNDSGASIKSAFENGALTRPGWTEAYLWAQYLCFERGFTSVANCSFGGFHHAMDGSGWESYQLSRVSGKGKPGHIIVAAAGPGNGRALHATCFTGQCNDVEVITAWQPSATTYNLWVDRKQGALGLRDFALVVRREGQIVFSQSGRDLPANFWNGKQQSTIRLEGRGAVEFEFVSHEHDETRFDIFISEDSPVSDEHGCACASPDAHFCDCINPELVSEPAVFAQVIAVGLKEGSYGVSDKPDVLLAGAGPISFRTPEVTLAASRALVKNPGLDCEAVKTLCKSVFN